MMSDDYESIPSVMKEREQWICWREETRDGEVTKVPVDASGGFASTTDSSTWSSFDTAREAHEGGSIDTDGLGFVFDERSTLMGVDLDDCRDPETAEPTNEAQQIIDNLDSWTEVSPSGTGYHVIVQGFVPDGGNRGDIDDVSHLEMYDKSRYFTVTGDHVEGTSEDVETRPSVVKELHSEYVADDDGNDHAGDPDPTGDVSLDDSELIEKAKNAKNGDKFERLWRGDTSAHSNDHSRADLALCSSLAFWTGGDAGRVDELFRQSGLMRDKWDEGRGNQTYGEMTVEKAVSDQSDFYEPGSSPRAARSDGGSEAVSTSASTRATPGPSEPFLTSRTFMMYAGLDPEDDKISDLNDRQKAAHVWTMIKNSEDVHIRVNRDNDEIWSFDDETGTWSPDGERALRHVACKVLLAENYGGNVLEELKNQARADPTVEVWGDVFGLEAGKVAVKNGLLDLSEAAGGDSAVRDLEPEDYALTRLPVNYDPEAAGSEWSGFVDDVIEDEMVDAVQEYVGYCLHRDPTFDRSLLLVGGGANGKSTFLNVIQELLGEDNTTNVSPYDFGDKPSMAELHGALANISADLAGGSLQGKNLGNFKKLTGGDSVTAKRLYKDPFKFTYDGGMLFAANEVPDVPVSNDDAAFWRRWIIVHFDNYFPEGSDKRDPNLEGRLKKPENLSAVLNWAVEGWARLMDQSAFTNVSATPDETRRKWQKWGDSIDEFLSDIVTRDEDAENISTGEAFQVYRAWCRVNDRDAVGRQTFTSRAKDADDDLGYKTSVRTKRSTTPVRGYKAFGTTDAFPDPSSILSEESDDGRDDDDDDTEGTGLGDFDDADADDDDSVDDDDDSLEGEPLGAPITHYIRQNDDGGGVARGELVEHLREQGAAEKAIDYWIDKLLDDSEIGQRDGDKFTV